MDRKKRVETVLQRQRTDRIPRGELLIDDEVVAEFLGVTDVAHRHRSEFADRMGLDLISLPTEYGVSSKSRRLPTPEANHWKDIDRWCAETDRRFVMVMLDGGFSWGIKLLGFTDFMTSLMRRSSGIASLLEEVDALNFALMERAAALGADGIVIADDIAYAGGLMVGPEVLRQLFFPSVSRQAEHAHRLGLRAVFHSDGDLNPVLDELAATGVDGLQCIERAAGMDLREIRQRYGKRLCLWGNLDPALLVDPLNPPEFDRQVNAILDAAEQGGVIIGTSSGLFKGMHPENLHYLARLLSPHPA